MNHANINTRSINVSLTRNNEMQSVGNVSKKRKLYASKYVQKNAQLNLT